MSPHESDVIFTFRTTRKPLGTIGRIRSGLSICPVMLPSLMMFFLAPARYQPCMWNRSPRNQGRSMVARNHSKVMVAVLLASCLPDELDELWLLPSSCSVSLWLVLA